MLIVLFVLVGAAVAAVLRYIVIFGVINLPVIALLAIVARSGFASLWCAWAAVISVFIAAHLRRRPHAERPTDPLRSVIAT